MRMNDIAFRLAVLATCFALSLPLRASATERRYFIAAEPVLWNYAPKGINAITGAALPRVPSDQIGTRYRKAIYRGYADASFTTRSATPSYFGTLGPTIRAAVGDTIVVVFRNRTALPVSIHPHGVFYTKSSEGARYRDGSSPVRTDGAVAPGASVTYRWSVPDRAGPGPMDGSSVLWMYHSHTHEVADLAAGLLGPIVVTRRAIARADGTPRDVDREVFTAFEMVDENQSTYAERNIAEFVRDKTSVTPAVRENPVSPFYASNEVAAINGYIYGNGPMIELRRGERVRWYLVSGASDYFNYHTAHWHGMTGLAGGMRTDMSEMLPGSMKVVDFVPDDPGIWLYHCHVGPHLLGGMISQYRVR